MRGQVLEVVCEPTEAALPALKGLGVFDEVALYGASIHVVADRVADRIPELRDALSRAGVAVSEVLLIPASLEDVFISRIR